MARNPKLTLQQIRVRYLERGGPFPADLEQLLREDPRPGARKILATLDRRRRANRAEGQRLRHLLQYERERWARGVQLIAGVDEVGMAPLAGPVVAGAVILPVDFRLHGIDDSKKLDGETREELGKIVREKAVAWALGWVDVETIDRINIYHAGLLAMRRAVEALAVRPQALLIDARNLPDLPIPQLPLVKGDERSISIAAASIVAKTARDAYMRELDRTYPGYGFASNVGYPTPSHRRALREKGVLPVHRRTFGMVREILAMESMPELPFEAEGMGG